jgi:hypothetical protein
MYVAQPNFRRWEMEDFHVLVATGRLYDMQLNAIELSQQRVKLRDPNMMLVDCNSVIIVLQ